jgi:methyl-accepting chemotaxis protein
MMKEIIQKIEVGAGLVKETDTKYRDAALKVHKVTDLIGEVSNASAEQTKGIERVNQAVAEMDRVTQDNAANAEESASAAVDLETQAERMEGILGELIALVGTKRAGGDGKEPRPMEVNHSQVSAIREQSKTGFRKTLPPFMKKGRDIDKPITLQKMEKIKPDEVIPMEESDFKDV